ncbi:MAG: oxidoreductase [Thermoleophilia bacterium]|nr:oxidoreductase [Thermoleophilia bacterium]
MDRLWLATAGIVAWYRILLPVFRSAFHRLRVDSVVRENEDTVSITLRGRRLDRLPIQGGQFLQWRFLRAGLWWQAHPYSISSLPTRDTIRFTVKRLGDHSDALLDVAPGTRVAIEGPYGTFTRHRLTSRRVLLIGAGVGVTPVRALLEDLPEGCDVVVLLRTDRPADLVLAEEVMAFVDHHGGRAVTLVGPPDEVPIDAEALRDVVPDAATREVDMCGPAGFMHAMGSSMRDLGVPSERIHHEAFTF